ncbi:MAG: hypothetical protein SPE59_01670 [Treponema sp.]|nr:hypothetical protein [Treponema sp.]
MNKSNITVVKIVLATVFFSIFLFFSGCSKQTSPDRIVIWTDNAEFAQYTELFNKTHSKDKAIVVYKSNPALALPPAKDELPPDIIVGSWLRTDSTPKYFRSLDYIFDHQILTSKMFYPELFESGKSKQVQYLLPVSFNLPVIIFSKENKNFVDTNYSMSLEQLRKISAEYNQKNKKGNYTRIGFSPYSNSDFLYLVTKLNDVNFHGYKNTIVWDNEALLKTVADLQDWINTDNTSCQTEEDFAFKYLFMPYYRQVTSGRTLFSYTTSDQLFKVMNEQIFNIDYRWIYEKSKIPIEDSYKMMGIYKNAANIVGASEFITWFFQPENQKLILERKESLNLQVDNFGIAGGFSAIREVTEHYLPVYYKPLLENLPPSTMIEVSQKLPARWESYRNNVVVEYLRTAISSPEQSPSITELEKDWRRKMSFN